MNYSQKPLLSTLVCLVLGACSAALGQAINAAPAPSQIAGPIDDARLVQLYGNIHPSAIPAFDRGLVESSLPLQRMILVLKRSPQQEAALEKFMAEQYDPKSSNFHHWLEPEEFGALYGPSEMTFRL